MFSVVLIDVIFTNPTPGIFREGLYEINFAKFKIESLRWAVDNKFSLATESIL